MNEIMRPNPTAVPLATNIQEIPNNIIAIPNNINFIIMILLISTNNKLMLFVTL